MLSSEAISEADILARRWDGAAAIVYRVDWSNPADRVAVFAGTLGEIERGPTGYRVELRSLAHALNQTTGRVFAAACDADLGDARCGVDLDDPSYAGSGAVVAVQGPQRFTVSGLNSFAADWFRGGKLTWTSGANAGLEAEVRRHVVEGSDRILALFEPPAFAIAPGNGFDILAGCDKRVETCHAKFANVVNFRGFPHMTGND